MLLKGFRPEQLAALKEQMAAFGCSLSGVRMSPASTGEQLDSQPGEALQPAQGRNGTLGRESVEGRNRAVHGGIQWQYRFP